MSDSAAVDRKLPRFQTQLYYISYNCFFLWYEPAESRSVWLTVRGAAKLGGRQPAHFKQPPGFSEQPEQSEQSVVSLSCQTNRDLCILCV